jgi:hypothetical protein
MAKGQGQANVNPVSNVALGLLLTVLCILSAMLFFSALGLADGSDDLAIRSFSTNSSSSVTIKAERLTLIVLWLLVTGVIFIGLVSGKGSQSDGRLSWLRKGPGANNLFLGMQFVNKGVNDRSTHSGFLRSLGLAECSFVSDTALKRGDEIEIDLRSLPGYAGNNFKVTARVKKTRSVAGDLKHVWVEALFTNLADEEKSALFDFLKSLSAPRRVLSEV